MLILNFTHPLTEEQCANIKQLAGMPIAEIRTIPVHVQQDQSLVVQMSNIVDSIALTPEKWQNLTLLINPPGYAPAASVLLAELHGRMGHFPILIIVRPKAEVFTTYEVAELVDLQTVRDRARIQCFPGK